METEETTPQETVSEFQSTASRIREEKTQEALDHLVLDASVNKYDLIILARRWAYELKTREGETRSVQDLIPESIREILSSKVSHKTIRELPMLKLVSKKAKSPATAIFDNIGKNSDGESEKEEKPKKK